MAPSILGGEENLTHPLIDSQHIGHQWTDRWNSALVVDITEAVKTINKKKKHACNNNPW